MEWHSFLSRLENTCRNVGLLSIDFPTRFRRGIALVSWWSTVSLYLFISPPCSFFVPPRLAVNDKILFVDPSHGTNERSRLELKIKVEWNSIRFYHLFFDLSRWWSYFCWDRSKIFPHSWSWRAWLFFNCAAVTDNSPVASRAPSRWIIWN